MSQMLPNDPQALQAMLAGLGGPGGAPAGPPPDAGGMPPPDAGQMPAGPDVPDEDWLVTAINAVHDGMLREGDSRQVSLLASILDKLTTFQATHLNPKAPQA